MVQTLPLDWVEEIKQELFTMEEAPLLPPRPPFPLAALNEQLFSKLGLKASVTLGELKAVSFQELEPQLAPGTSRLFSFALPPYSSSLYGLIGHEQLNQIAAALLADDMEAAVSLQSALQESFYLFLGAVTLDALAATNHFKEFSLRLLNTAASLKESSKGFLTLPVSVQLPERAVPFLIIIPESLQQEMKKGAAKTEELFINESLTSSRIQLATRLLLEWVNLPLSQVNDLREGSFLVLDKAKIDLNQPLASCQLVVGRRPFFAGEVHGNQLTLKALAEPIEEIKTMEAPKPKAPDNEPPKAPEGATPPPAAAPTPSAPPPGEDKYFLGEDEEFFVEDEKLAQILKEEAPKTAEQPAAAAKGTLVEPVEESKAASLTEVSLPIEVVIGYLRLSVKDLVGLQVGSSYTLGSPISSQVDLLLHGKRIARGELIKSGDVLGVRILSL